MFDATWGGSRLRFAAELKALSTPRAIAAAIGQARKVAAAHRALPLVVTTYLANDQIAKLEQARVSGIDLCGNGILIAPGKLLVCRTGAPNRFPRSAAIRNVYGGTSSLVARAVLLHGNYNSLQSLASMVRSLGASITMSTVSKVCQQLEADLIVERGRTRQMRNVRLLQPDKLLDKLAAAFRPPRVTRRLAGKWRDPAAAPGALAALAAKGAIRVCRTGADSAPSYVTTVREPVERYYCTRIGEATELPAALIAPTARFPTVELLETDDPTGYFDVRPDLLASPIQAFLELQAGDKREQDAAEDLRKRILQEANGGLGNP